MLRHIRVDGAARFYEAAGEGPSVVLIHGSLSSSRQWRKLTERLCGCFRVLAPELYAAEASSAEHTRIGDFSFAEDCAFVRRLIEGAADAVHVAGHSWGGVIAARAALDLRDRIASLTLIEPSCFHLLDRSGPEYTEIFGVYERGRDLFERGETRAAARFFVDYWMEPGAFDAMPAARREPIVAAMVRLHQDWAGTLDMNTTLDEFRAFAPRTLLIRARDTRRPSARIVDLIGEALPNAIRVTIERGGHMSPITNPEPVNNAIEAFLDGRLRARA
ncbi:MAG TPA: alpha/beta hydrolase [Xanthobacteraceae bacterium]|nr:alpha/beta hydrolase [Xanthobacteraceae bacterium]